MDSIKTKTRPIYSELQGYLSQAPTGDGFIYELSQNLWQQFNKVVDELNQVLGSQDFDRFKITQQHFEGGGSGVPIAEYRSKVSGLISKLHGTYFYDEPAPFSGAPAQVISQVQNQHQSAQVVMLLEIQDKLNEKIAQAEEDSNEKSFLEAIKSKLSTVKDAIEFTKLVVVTAKEFGLDVSKVGDIFK